MISIKTEKEIQIMKKSGNILSRVMKELKKKVKPGITTKELDRVTETLIFKSGAQTAFKDYEGFPTTLCISVNQVVVHGIPSDYKLKEGDIISLDLGVKYKDFFSDMAITVPVGKINYETLRLLKVTKKALKLGIKKASIGNTFGDIGETVQKYVESQGFNVVRELCGHGIGRELHEEPQILNYAEKHKSEKIKQGMVFCIEPMVTVGDWRLKKSADGFGYETKDGSLSAHFEHTIAVTKNGSQVLTEIK